MISLECKEVLILSRMFKASQGSLDETKSRVTVSVRTITLVSDEGARVRVVRIMYKRV